MSGTVPTYGTAYISTYGTAYKYFDCQPPENGSECNNKLFFASILILRMLGPIIKMQSPKTGPAW